MHPLLAAIYDDLDDLDARRVYADHLLEQGDPCGAYLAATLDPSPAAQKRAGVLFNVHRERLLGVSLNRCLINPVFHAGFLHSAGLARHGHAAEADWEVLVHSPTLRSLRVLARGDGNLLDYGNLLHTPTTNALQHVELPNLPLARHFATAPSRPSLIRYLGPPSPDLFPVLGSGPAFRALAHLDLRIRPQRPYSLPDLLAGLHAHLPHLDTLTVATLPATEVLAWWPNVQVRCLSTGTMRLHRTVDGCTLSCHGYAPRRALDEAIAATAIANPSIRLVASSGVVAAHHRKEAARLRGHAVELLQLQGPLSQITFVG